MEIIRKTHECRGYMAYRFIRRYLMTHYPKIAREIFVLIETQPYEAIKKKLPKDYRKIWYPYVELFADTEIAEIKRIK